MERKKKTLVGKNLVPFANILLQLESKLFVAVTVENFFCGECLLMSVVLVTEVRISATKAVTIHKDANTLPKHTHIHMCTHTIMLATDLQAITYALTRAMRSATDAVL